MPLRNRPRRWIISSLAFGAVAIPLTGTIATVEASASVLPNPCALLSSVQPQNTIGAGKHVTIGRPKTVSKTATDKSCSEAVGAITVYLDLSKYAGGFGGVKITSTTHPSGVGTGDELVVGTGLGDGGPVDFINFHKRKIYASISANGALPSNLIALPRQVYKKL